VTLRTAVGDLVETTPVVSDYYLYYRAFWRRVAACRGVYKSFAEAEAAAPPSVRCGYNQEGIGQTDSVAWVTARSDIGEMERSDYPVLFWLTPLLQEGTVVFNLGGNVGLEYYAYRQRTPFPDRLRWIVCEIPEIVKAGEAIAAARDADLEFTTRFEDASGSDVLLTCGTLQYLPVPLADMVAGLSNRPSKILINRVPLSEQDTFVTLQNLGYSVTPYRIQNRRELIEQLEGIGYKLVDAWHNDRVTRIPFHPKLTVRGYHGMYFALEGR